MLRRAGRHLFTVLSALSLLLCVATCVLWVRSYWRQPELFYDTPNCDRSIQFAKGFVCVVELHGYEKRSPPFNLGRRGWNWLDAGEPRNGFDEARKAAKMRLYPFLWFDALSWSNGNFVQRYVVVPIWIIALLSIPVPAVWFASYRRRRAIKRGGLCANCGYDLRKSPERCPECGTAIAVKTKQLPKRSYA